MTTESAATRHLRATAADLEPAVAAALADPSEGRPRRVTVAGADGGVVDFALLEWPAPAAGPSRGDILLLHGITNSARGWWRIAPALAAGGHRVIAVDGPGHGETRGWSGGAAFADTAALIAALVREPALALDERLLAVIGHSWGSLVAAAIPSAGPVPHLVPRRVVLLDPPALTDAEIGAIIVDSIPPPTLADAAAALRAANPGWHPRDVEVKAAQLFQFEPERLVRIGRENRWDGGLSAIEAAGAAGYPLERYRVVRGIPALGGMLPDAVVPRLAALIGEANVVTLADAPHSPQRTHPEALTLALLRAVA